MNRIPSRIFTEEFKGMFCHFNSSIYCFYNRFNYMFGITKHHHGFI